MPDSIAHIPCHARRATPLPFHRRGALAERARDRSPSWPTGRGRCSRPACHGRRSEDGPYTSAAERMHLIQDGAHLGARLLGVVAARVPPPVPTSLGIAAQQADVGLRIEDHRIVGVGVLIEMGLAGEPVSHELVVAHAAVQGDDQLAHGPRCAGVRCVEEAAASHAVPLGQSPRNVPVLVVPADGSRLGGGRWVHLSQPVTEHLSLRIVAAVDQERVSRPR